MKDPKTMLDDDGIPVGDGDTIKFSYGIPPVYVSAAIVRQKGALIVFTPGHNPTQCPLRELRECVGAWYVDQKKEGAQ